MTTATVLAPEVVEILAPGATPEMSDVPIYEGAPDLAHTVLTHGLYHGVGALAAGTDAEWLCDVVLYVTPSSSAAKWERHGVELAGPGAGVCRCGLATTHDVHFA